MISNILKKSIRATPALKQMARRAIVMRPKQHACFTTYFTESHEWIDVNDGVGTIGISDFAQKALGDVVYVELPEIGDSFDAEEAFGSVESVKAASDVYVPVGGEVVEINDNLTDSPNLVNESPTSDGWFVKVKIEDESELEGLMDEAAYQTLIDNE